VIDPKLLRSDPEAVARNMARRGITLDVGALKALEERRKPWQVEAERLRSERNANDKAIGMRKARARTSGLSSLRVKGSSQILRRPRTH
jgi:seryl-tRNA synthetase